MAIGAGTRFTTKNSKAIANGGGDRSSSRSGHRVATSVSFSLKGSSCHSNYLFYDHIFPYVNVYSWEFSLMIVLLSEILLILYLLTFPLFSCMTTHRGLFQARFQNKL